MTAERAILIASQAGNGEALIAEAYLLYVLAGGAVILFLLIFGIISLFGEHFVDWINDKLEHLNEGKR